MAIKMFSEEDIQVFRIIIDLPKQEVKENLIEQFISRYPLSTLKLDSMSELLIMMRKTFDQLPMMVLSGSGVSLNISKEKLTLEIGSERATQISSAEEGSKEVKPFSEDNLKRITTDFNFVTASILGLLHVESLKSEGYFRVSKKIDHDLRFDSFFDSVFWGRFKDFKDTHVVGIQIEFDQPVMGISARNKIRLNSENRRLTGIISFNFELKSPIDLSLIVKDILEMVNVIYRKLTEVP
jgi:hypothetical protein